MHKSRSTQTVVQQDCERSCTRTFRIESSKLIAIDSVASEQHIWLPIIYGDDALVWPCSPHDVVPLKILVMKTLTFQGPSRRVREWVSGPGHMYVIMNHGGSQSGKLGARLKRSVGWSFWRKHLWWQTQVPLRLTILVCSLGQACGRSVRIWTGLPSKYVVPSPTSSSGVITSSS